MNSRPYAILCYEDERITCAWSREQDDVVMAKLAVIQDKLARQGKLGPVARLLPTTAATTVRRDTDQPVMLDGPIAKNKEQLLGFYVVECADLEEVLAIARELGKASPSGADEIRPLAIFRLGQIGATAEPIQSEKLSRRRNHHGPSYDPNHYRL